MPKPAATLFFDFTDPLSYLLERELAALESALSGHVARAPFELRPPPEPLVTIDHPTVADRWSRAWEAAAEVGVRLSPPDLVPWTRKAHELHALAASHGLAAEVREKIFDAFMLKGRDIGRVDVLVEIGQAVGLDRTETKATLDVDRYEAEVREAREAALAEGIRTVPHLARGSEALEGFHNRAALRTFLRVS